MHSPYADDAHDDEEIDRRRPLLRSRRFLGFHVSPRVRIASIVAIGLLVFISLFMLFQSNYANLAQLNQYYANYYNSRYSQSSAFFQHPEKMQQILNTLTSSSASGLQVDSSAIQLAEQACDELARARGRSSGERQIESPQTRSKSSSPLAPSSSSSSPSHSSGEWIGLRALRSYAHWHRASLQSNAAGNAPKIPYLIWTIREYTGAGMGNRIIGCISALLLAMATDRIFLIDDQKLSGFRHNALDLNLPPDARPIQYHHQVGMNVEATLACDDVKSLWSKYSSVSIESTQYFLPLMTHNIHMRDALQAHFGGGSSYFQHLFPYLFLPPASLINPLQTYARRHFQREVEFQEWDHSNGGKGWSGAFRLPHRHVAPSEPDQPACVHVIGMQIRQEHMIDPDRDREVFHQCGIALARMRTDWTGTAHASDVIGNQDAGSKMSSLKGGSSSSALSSLGAASSNACEVRYFIATENRKWVDSAGWKLKRLPWYNGPHGVEADVYLLALTDQLIITFPRSTFGFMASGLMGSVPYAVNSNNRVRQSCTRLLSTEPCFHGWFRRRSLRCYKEEIFETPDMINFDNCYQCHRDANRGEPQCCPCGYDVPSDVTCPADGTCVPD